MEKLKSIKSDEFIKGWFIEMECCMCMESATIAARSKKELKEALDEAGWKELTSDMYGLIGHHCGCDYRDDK